MPPEAEIQQLRVERDQLTEQVLEQDEVYLQIRKELEIVRERERRYRHEAFDLRLENKRLQAEIALLKLPPPAKKPDAQPIETEGQVR